MDTHLNLFTDFGFKKLFGEEVNKELLIDFLNELLRDEAGEIIDLTYLKTEHLGNIDENRKAIFDIYCENQDGEKFIVEMQKTKQKYFKDRTLYYSTFPIAEQALKSDWNFNLKAVYTIAILDFTFNDGIEHPDKYCYHVKFTDIETQEIFYDKLTFIYLEMPKFAKPLEALSSKFEKWLFFIKNLHELESLPVKFQERIFEKAFAAADISKYNAMDKKEYTESLKAYRDIKNSLDTAKEEGEIIGYEKGLQEGIEKGRGILILDSLRRGYAAEEIASFLKVHPAQVAQMKILLQEYGDQAESHYLSGNA